MKVGYWLGTADLYGGGVGSYAWRVLNCILEHTSSSEFNLSIICGQENQKDCLDLAKKNKINIKTVIIPNLNVIQKSCDKVSNFFQETFYNSNYHLLTLSKYLSPWYYWYNSLDLDILHIPYQLSSIYSIIAKGNINYPFIITMHDLQELHYPEFFSPFERSYRAKFFWKAIENSTGVISSFQHVKDDIKKYFLVPESKLYLCSIPFQTITLKKYSNNEAKTYEKKYQKFKENFLLYPAQTWEHKNHLSLIMALEILEEEYEFKINLICTGRKNPNFFPKLSSYLSTSRVSQNVTFTDIVDEEELYWLYKHCSLVVIPTLYEAGSFPLMEAMKLHVAVICSSVTSLPETIHDQRFIFDPHKPKEIANLIYKILNNPELYQSNIDNSKLRIQELSKVDTFSDLQECWYSVLKNR